MMKKHASVLAGTGAVLALGLWNLLDIEAAVHATGADWMWGVYAGLLVLAVGGAMGLGWLLLSAGRSGRKGKAGGGFPLERIYPAAGLFLGILYLFVLPPLSAPDEISHFISAYQLSNRIMGLPSNASDGRVLLRPEDVWLEDLDGIYEFETDGEGNQKVVLESAEGSQVFGEVLDESVYETIRELWPNGAYMPERTQEIMVQAGLSSETGQISGADPDRPSVGSMQPPVTTTPLAYAPQAAGITLGRLLGLHTLPLLYLGRLCNLLFFVLMTWLAMKRLPFGKEVLFGTALLPMTLHLSASFSYDVMIMGALFCFTAVCLDLAYKKERVSWQDVLALAVLMAAAGPCKMVYAVFLGLCLLIPVRKFGGWGRWAAAALVVGGAWAAAMYLVNSQVIVSYATTVQEESYVQWAGETGYSFALMIHQPLRTLKMFYQTLLWQAQHYHLTMIGAYLGNLDQVLDVPYLLVAAFTLGLLGLALKKPGENETLQGGRRIWVFLLCGGCAAAIMASMLIAWTPLSSNVIVGVQGRYFLPFLPLLLMALKNDGVVLTKDINRRILYLMCCMNSYELLHLFCVVCMRV